VELGMTVLIVEHRLDLVSKICDRIIVMEAGAVVFEGMTRDVLSETEISRYGVTEPTIVKLAKRLGIKGSDLPLDSVELKLKLVSK